MMHVRSRTRCRACRAFVSWIGPIVAGGAPVLVVRCPRCDGPAPRNNDTEDDGA